MAFTREVIRSLGKSALHFPGPCSSALFSAPPNKRWRRLSHRDRLIIQIRRQQEATSRQLPGGKRPNIVLCERGIFDSLANELGPRGPQPRRQRRSRARTETGCFHCRVRFDCPFLLFPTWLRRSSQLHLTFAAKPKAGISISVAAAGFSARAGRKPRFYSPADVHHV